MNEVYGNPLMLSNLHGRTSKAEVIPTAGDSVDFYSVCYTV